MRDADSPAGAGWLSPHRAMGPKPMRYQPIENHGIVGNMHSAALAGLDGSVDWLCLPRFDSPSVPAPWPWPQLARAAAQAA